MKTLIALSLPFLLSVSPAATSANAPGPGDELVIEFEGGTPLSDFIKLAQTMLGKQIHYKDYDIKDIVLQAHGQAKVERAEFRRFVESTLYSEGFLLVEIGDALHVRSTTGIRGPNKVGYLKSSAKLVQPDQLSKYEGRYVVITSIIPVKNAAPMELVNTLQTYFTDPTMESVRVAGSSIVATGLADTIINTARMVEALDVNEGDQAVRRGDAMSARVATLEKRVAELEATVKTLKAGGDR